MIKKFTIIIGLLISMMLQGCALYYQDNTIYPCTIGCGNENITPPKGYVYYQKRLMTLSEFNRITGQNLVIR